MNWVQLLCVSIGAFYLLAGIGWLPDDAKEAQRCFALSFFNLTFARNGLKLWK